MKLGKRLLAVTTVLLLLLAGASTSVSLVGSDGSGALDGNPLLWHSDGDLEAGLLPGHNWQSAGHDGVRLADGHNWQSVPVPPGEDSGGSTWDGGTDDDEETAPAGGAGSAGV